MPRRAALAFLFFAVSVSVLAQGGSSVAGVVADPQGGRVVGATIHIENRQFRRKLVSNESGEFAILLPTGKYKFRVERDGFIRSKVKKVRVLDGKPIKLSFVLVGIRNDSKHP